jgi:hypothetical protein
MFNSDLKKQSLKRLEDATKKYKSITELVQTNSLQLLNSRKPASDLINKVEEYINTLANTPKEFNSKIEEIKINIRSFSALLDLEFEDDKNKKISGSIVGGGIAAGVGVAAFAPTAAMAFATTFGTASTGTAIATLAGAAQTSAALAYLGGGALVAGGGGMAAGNALLALAGPVGWAIGGAALVGGGLLTSSKNKKIAAKAENEAIEIEKQISVFSAINTEIKEIITLTDHQKSGLQKQLDIVKGFRLTNYMDFSSTQKYELGSLANNTLSLSKLLNRKIGQH